MSEVVGAKLNITRTRSKKYVGICDYPGCHDGQDGAVFTTAPGRYVEVSSELRRHHRVDHDVEIVTLFPERITMKQPTGDLPEPNEKLGDYKDHVVVFSEAGQVFKKNTVHGDRECIEARVDVLVSGGWKTLGVVPVFFKNVLTEIAGAGGEPIGGVLRQGIGTGKDRTWHLDPVAKSDKTASAALADWTPDKATSF